MAVVQLVKGRGLHPWYLRLVADNGLTIATSEGYYSRWNAKRAARRNYPNTKFVDLTKREGA